MPITDTPMTTARPTGSPKGGVIVIQEGFGVNGHIADICGRLAEAGWLAVAPHLYHRTGNPVFGYDDIPSIFPHIEAMTLETVFEDIDAAIETLAAEGFAPDRQGVVGFCLGGEVTFWAAARRSLGAAVTFYGGGINGRWCFPSQIEAAPSLLTPWLGQYGDHDHGIPVEDVEQLRLAAAQAAVPTEVCRYADADHGFNCDQRPTYHGESAALAWTRMLAWFDRFIPPTTQ